MNMFLPSITIVCLNYRTLWIAGVLCYALPLTCDEVLGLLLLAKGDFVIHRVGCGAS